MALALNSHKTHYFPLDEVGIIGNTTSELLNNVACISLANLGNIFKRGRDRAPIGLVGAKSPNIYQR